MPERTPDSKARKTEVTSSNSLSVKRSGWLVGGQDLYRIGGNILALVLEDCFRRFSVDFWCSQWNYIGDFVELIFSFQWQINVGKTINIHLVILVHTGTSVLLGTSDRSMISCMKVVILIQF